MQLGVAIKIIKQNKMKCSSLTSKLLMIKTQARHHMRVRAVWDISTDSAAAACDVIARESDSHSHIDNVSSQVQARHHNWLCRRARKSFCRETSPIR